jgi:hypothetical protein
MLYHLLEEAFIWCFVGVPDQQDAEEAARKAEAAQKQAADIASGAVQMNGRELFQHEPWVFDNNIYWDTESMVVSGNCSCLMDKCRMPWDLINSRTWSTIALL